MKKRYYIILLILAVSHSLINSQPAPAADENIPYLVTFGGNSETSWGDDDFCQVFFFLIPSSYEKPVYIRVFDPDTGGELDEEKTNFNTQVKFSVYGGSGCWSTEDAQGVDPKGNYKSGLLLSTKTFKNESEYDKQWYTFGPFNPFEGEYVKKYDGRIFKVIAQGISGDDGNLYRYFMSTSADENIEIEGGNVFTYEYTFRLANNVKHVSQIYPFIDDKTISVEISNFDWDDDGVIRIISVAKNGEKCQISSNDNWVKNEFPIIQEEHNTSLEIQFVKNQTELVKNNNVAVIVKNQYGELLPFFVIPIGGVPVYNPKINMKGL
ncbi:MAG: hypothetical protein MI922_00835 [Bacteroidales bacterium]|nr:hypothetical protein [Bacteroidales bacterium]